MADVVTGAKRFLVIGLDEFGSWLARELHAAGHRVVAVDARGERVDGYREWIGRGIVADATRIEVLRELGAASMDAVVLTAGEGMSSHILTAIALRGLGVENLLVEVESAEAALALERIGVRLAIHPAREAAHRLARRLPRLVEEGGLGE